MNIRTPAVCLAILSFLLAPAASQSASQSAAQSAAQPAGQPSSRPNIILFLVDDMGWQDTSVAFGSEPTPFNRHFRTPGMERLARQGVLFTDCYSHAVCSPTRTSIMTGQNPCRHHVTNWTLHADRDQSGKWGRVGAPREWRKEGLQPADEPLPMLLRQAGYFTIHCGKAHWGANGTKGSDPRNLGFDVNIAGHAAGGPGSYHGKTNFGNKEKGGRTMPWGIPGLEKYHGEDVHLTDALTTEAQQAVTRAVAAKKPFYLYMAHYAVHAPIQPHDRFMANYAGRKYADTEIDIPPAEQKYASMIEGMDASLGSLLAHVESLGVGEDTLVIFTSDNGGLSAHARGKSPRGTGLNTHNWPLRAGKGSAYEGGTRVPFLVAWAKPNPDNRFQKELPLQPGAKSAQPLICEDLFPTVLGIAGVSAPANRAVDGVDMRSYWLAEKSDPDRKLVFHYPHVWGPRGPGYEPHSAMRIGKWKVIYFYNSRRWELYDLVNDIGEMRDLAQSQPQRLTAMAAELVQELQRLDAQWPVDRKSGAADPPRLPGSIAARPPIRVVELSGSPKERGIAHGKALKSEIHELVARWKDELRKTYGLEADEFIRRFRQKTDFESAIDKWTPGLLDEVRGIAEGAELDYETIYVYQLIDEIWAQGRMVVDKCSSIGVDRRDDTPTIVAQNLDIPEWYHGYQTLLHITDAKAKLQTFVVTLPGLVGANGMNDARIGVCVNTLLQLQPCPDGLPVAFVVRGVLQHKDWSKARRFLYDVRHASGQNYMLGGPDVAHSFECSAGRVLRFAPFESARHTWHTNHPLRNEQWADSYRAQAASAGKTPKDALPDCPRFQSLTTRLPAKARVDFDLVLATLRSKDRGVPICNAHTFACTIMLLGAVPELHVSAGGADVHAIRVFRFTP